MPKIKVNGVELYYEDTGGIGKEVIVFSHGLLLNCRMFDAQVAAFSSKYRCITYDHRGQGQSEVTESGYDMETVYEDAAQLLRALDAVPCHFVGIGMGGYVGMRIASRQPKLLKSLVLIETSADRESEYNASRYKLLTQIFRWFGPRWAMQPALNALFGQKFLNDSARANQQDDIKRQLAALNRTSTPRAVLGVVNRSSVYNELGNIRLPSLIMVGDEDLATMPERSKRIAEKIPNSKLAVIPGGGHSSTLEEPEMVNKLIELFLNNQKNPAFN